MSELTITRVPQFLDPWFTEIEQVWDEIEASVNDIETRVEALEAGGSSTWGAITGTLSDQTDLQTALDAKLPKVQADNYRVMATNGSATIAETAAITPAKALKSDANGIPTHFDTSVEPSITELQKVKGVTSAIQTQLNAKAANILSGAYTPAPGTVAIGDTLEDAIEKIVGNTGTTVVKYSHTMTGDVFVVSTAMSNTLGANMAQVGSVQLNSVVINSTDDILELRFSALQIPSGTADLLLGYQIGANTPVWGTYLGHTTFIAILNESITGITPGTYTVKLMAAKSGSGSVSIAASDCTSFGIDQMPGGSIFTGRVISALNVISSSVPLVAGNVESYQTIKLASPFNVVTTFANGGDTITPWLFNFNTTKNNQVVRLSISASNIPNNAIGFLVTYILDSGTETTFAKARSQSVNDLTYIIGWTDILVSTVGSHSIQLRGGHNGTIFDNAEFQADVTSGFGYARVEVLT